MRSSFPFSSGDSGPGSSLANQRITPSFAAHNNATSMSVSDTMNALNLRNNGVGGIGGNGFGNDTTTLTKGAIGGNNLLKGGNLNNGMDVNKRKRLSEPNDNDTSSISKSSKTPSLEDTNLLQRLNALSGGFRMPKWARANSNGGNSSTSTTTTSTTTTSRSNRSDVNSCMMGISGERKKGTSLQEMMNEKKRLELERVNKLSGGFPMPRVDADETMKGASVQRASLDGFRQVWLQTPPEYQKEVLSRRLEKGNMVHREKKRRTIAFAGANHRDA